MFRMYGRIVELYRYVIRYQLTIIKQGLNSEQITITHDREEYCISDEYRDEFIQHLGDTPYTVEPIDQTGNEWINGREFDSYDAALAALEAGQQPEPEIPMDLADLSSSVKIILGID